MLQHVVLVFLVCYSGCSCSAKTKDKQLHPPIGDIVTKRGYPFEVHHVTTSDGYILSMYRIPHSKTTKIVSTKPVLLQHGLSTSSVSFLLPEVTHGLGYIMSDNGYDVWLGNWRGTQYSRNHTFLNPDKDSQFWNFSWHEMGVFDLPAMIDYVLNATSQAKLHYAGHSQGATAFYVLATTRPEYNAKIKAQFSLGPVVYLKHTPSLVARTVAVFIKPVTKFVETSNINEVLSSQQFITRVFKIWCKFNPTTCGDVTSFVLGLNPNKLSVDLKTLLRFNPAGISIKQLLHYAQEVNSNCFRWYDYGENNLQIYGTPKPRVYNLQLVSSPSYLFYSRGDSLVAETDVSRLCRKMGNSCVEKILVRDYNFSHADFASGKTAPELVYPEMLRAMQRH